MVRRYAKLLRVQLSRALLVGMQYRFEFFLSGIMSAFWTAIALVPLFVLYGHRETVAGWPWQKSLLVVAFFTLLKGVMNSSIQPSMQAVVEHVRKGTLDFVLLKPADAQFLVSTAAFQMWRAADVLVGCGLVVYAMQQLHQEITATAALVCLALLLCAVVILYSIWLLVVVLAFSFVKVDNLSYFFMSLFDMARWPSNVFSGIAAFIFTFVLPFALMTTYPAQVLLGELGWPKLLQAGVTAAAFATLSRLLWLRSLKNYCGAGG